MESDILFNKNCPRCNRIQFYSKIQSLNVAIKKNTICCSCKNFGNKVNVGRPPWNKGLTKEIDERVKLIGLSNKRKVRSVEWRKDHSEKMKGKPAWNKGKTGIYSKETLNNMSKNNPRIWLGKHLPEQVRQKIRNKNIGMEVSESRRKRLSEINTGKIQSEETKLKHRLNAIERMKKQNIICSYNENACKFIDKINQTLEFKFQHALNGGEIKLYGYFVDGYDKEKNIVFEYDESHHYKADRNLKDKDIERQNNIINIIKPKMFIRYDEKNNRLYDAITNNTISIET